MSVTTTPSDQFEPTPPTGHGGITAWLGRFRRRGNDMPTEALEFFSPSQAVMARPAHPLANQITAIIGALVVSLLIVFSIVRVDRLATGQGKIVSMVPETVVQPLNAGVVKTIAVAQGDIVRKGQLLAQLDPTFASSDNTTAREQVDRYQTEVDRLTAELHQVPYKPKQLTPGALVQEGIYAQRAAAREAQLRYYQGQIEAQRAQYRLAEANVRQYAKQTGIASDLERIRAKLEADAVGSRIDTLAAVNQRLETERNVLTSLQQMDTAKQTIAALQGQLDNANQSWFADVSQTLTSDEVQLASYRNQLEHAALTYKLVDLRAQEDSIVLSVAPVSVGSVLQSGQTFFTLVPINAPFEVDAQITGDQAGFVVPGQAATIKFSTFDFMRFGSGTGTVRLISADSFSTNSGSNSGAASSGTLANSVYTGGTTTNPYFYDLRVTLDRLSMKHVPKHFRPTPGMPVEVDVKVGDRTVIEYIIERVSPILNDGMTEPN